MRMRVFGVKRLKPRRDGSVFSVAGRLKLTAATTIKATTALMAIHIVDRRFTMFTSFFVRMGE